MRSSIMVKVKLFFPSNFSEATEFPPAAESPHRRQRMSGGGKSVHIRIHSGSRECCITQKSPVFVLGIKVVSFVFALLMLWPFTQRQDHPVCLSGPSSPFLWHQLLYMAMQQGGRLYTYFNSQLPYPWPCPIGTTFVSAVIDGVTACIFWVSCFL